MVVTVSQVNRDDGLRDLEPAIRFRVLMPEASIDHRGGVHERLPSAKERQERAIESSLNWYRENLHDLRRYHKYFLTRDGKEIYLGNGSIEVSASEEGVVYHAPTLIYHYIVDHQYLPPQEFIDAVLRLPHSPQTDL